MVVTPGSTSLRATIGSTSHAGADLDLYVYNGTTGTCVLAGQSADGDREESVTVTNPAAATWVALVDGYAVPSGSTTFTYVDVFTNAAFGSITITLRPAGSSWTEPGNVTANAVPAAGGALLGSVQVRTNGNILVGSSDVVIKAATPQRPPRRRIQHRSASPQGSAQALRPLRFARLSSGKRQIAALISHGEAAL